MSSFCVCMFSPMIEIQVLIPENMHVHSLSTLLSFFKEILGFMSVTNYILHPCSDTPESKTCNDVLQGIYEGWFRSLGRWVHSLGTKSVPPGQPHVLSPFCGVYGQDLKVGSWT
ncbi:hypothetical protein ILYODFUR_011087 [Ilyodon furcidens]|uniref:Uncharacterized protein n=1 Tax=Ilyodon furcidens TaxID=33524 RepID=A0ABV0TUT9_9TELE